ncbi:hypothetical protein ACV229_05720 [Burkholderia sp. MR1-5-21]
MFANGIDSGYTKKDKVSLARLKQPTRSKLQRRRGSNRHRSRVALPAGRSTDIIWHTVILYSMLQLCAAQFRGNALSTAMFAYDRFAITTSKMKALQHKLDMLCEHRAAYMA